MLPKDMASMRATALEGSWVKVMQSFYEKSNLDDAWRKDLAFRDTIPPMAEKAMEEWKKLENAVLAANGLQACQLIELVERFLDTGDTNFRVKGYYNAVQNVGGPMAFVWRLPLLDPANMDKYQQTGRMMAIMFYCEMIYK